MRRINGQLLATSLIIAVCLVAVGVALDMTDREDAHATLDRHIAAHGGVLENLNTAIAIFGADTRLKFFNGAFARATRGYVGVSHALIRKAVIGVLLTFGFIEIGRAHV